MKVARLSTTDQILHDATHKFTITYADVAALGATNTAALALVPESGTFPAGTTVGSAKLVITDNTWDASDTGIDSILAEIGDGTDPNRFLGQVELILQGTEVVYTSAAANTQPYTYLAADTVDITFTVVTGGSPLLSEVNSGEIEVYLKVTQPFTDLAVVDGL